jgi:glycosyltransferase involved in cell wall biosynthesis
VAAVATMRLSETEVLGAVRTGGDRRRPARLRGSVPRRLRVALLAPPWLPVPPPGYGGIEQVIAQLAGGLVRCGHEVSLLAPPGSCSHAQVFPLLETTYAEQIGETMIDVDHVGRALAVIDEARRRGRPFDIIHDHSGFALIPIADRISVPVLHTVHGPVTEDVGRFYERYSDRVWLSALSQSQLSQAPDDVRCVGVIPNPIDLRAWPLQPSKERYLLWIGRFAPGKGPHRAIAAARGAEWPLVLAGPVQAGQQRFFDKEVAPHIDDVHVRYVGEVGGRQKQRLFAEAAALLMPIRWAEPFGMVMIEAMACGTPVIAFREGAAEELVLDGESGFLVDDEDEMAAAVGRLAELDPARCRGTVSARYDVDIVTQMYVAAYREIIGAAARHAPPESRENRHAAAHPQHA